MTHDSINARPALTQILEQVAEDAPHRGIAVYDRRGQNAERRTYPEIVELARGRAARLAAAGVSRGDRLLLALPTSWELLESFFGALELGALPVMVPPSGPMGSADAHLAKLEALMQVLTPTRLICDSALRDHLRASKDSPIAGAAAMTPTELGALSAGTYARGESDGSTTAFLQLTSGSTGRQRAVQVTHASAIHNAQAIGDFVSCRHDDVVVSWLPLNHDMGLVGCLLFSMVHGIDLWMLRPETFLARPALWLKAISSRRCSFTPAPNFAYQLCVERIEAEELRGVDLSAWKIAITGAEMIRPDTCTAFERKFGPFGFNANKWVSCYGMAECTLAATADRQHKGIRTVKLNTESAGPAQEIVCTGGTVTETEVRISSTATPGEFVPDETIGEIWVKGPGIFAGYYNNPAATAETLHDGWLRTGDLGFLKNKELYITGRIKDLLIIHGHNWMPHELEWEADAATGGGGAERSGAFSVDGGPDGEKAVIVIEYTPIENRTLAELDHDVRSRVGRLLGLPLADVVFVKRGQIPKTTSGKVQRGELRRRYLDGKLERLA